MRRSKDAATAREPATTDNDGKAKFNLTIEKQPESDPAAGSAAHGAHGGGRRSRLHERGCGEQGLTPIIGPTASPADNRARRRDRLASAMPHRELRFQRPGRFRLLLDREIELGLAVVSVVGRLSSGCRVFSIFSSPRPKA